MAEREKTTTRASGPGTRAGRPAGDARKSDDQLKRNQQFLGVGGDHKTETMKKHRRGTFP